MSKIIWNTKAVFYKYKYSNTEKDWILAAFISHENANAPPRNILKCARTDQCENF